MLWVFVVCLLGGVWVQPAWAVSFPVRAALLFNSTTGKVLYQLNPHLPIPPASLTKVMTLYLALDQVAKGRIALTKKVRISALAARTGGSSMHLRRGERVPFAKLLIGTAVPSGNDAAMAVAETVSPNIQRFVQMMNARAKALKMKRTVFCNPTGLPAKGQMSTAYDMLKLALAYMRRHPKALDFHSVATFSHGGRVLTTTNPLLGAVCGVNGLKTGWTHASGYNIIVTAKRGKTRLVCVIMGGKNRIGRDMTARKLIEAGFKAQDSPKKVLEILEARSQRR
ncbi:MAG: D-alanyl-D-alanine carboxypeptidase [Desulfovibrio sp.]|nr:D-alanyl-D-alanine carboxypeptidase [Desulfovibrio sp.]